jgi:hypothetical protein
MASGQRRTKTGNENFCLDTSTMSPYIRLLQMKDSFQHIYVSMQQTVSQRFGESAVNVLLQTDMASSCEQFLYCGKYRNGSDICLGPNRFQ